MNDPKVLLRPKRLREVPPRFSWCDQRLFRRSFAVACGSDALALYLFLLTVSDSSGLSYYSEASIGRYLPIDKVGADLLFQVLVGRHERRSLILTTNRAYKQWQEIFNHDSTLLDRLLHHVETVVIEGRS